MEHETNSIFLKDPSNLGLTEDELSYFREFGWVGKFPLIDRFCVDKLTVIYNNFKQKFTLSNELCKQDMHSLSVKPWFKSMHLHITEFRDIASHPLIVEKVSTILGNDIIAWGATVTERAPNQRHRWHVDIEHTYWKGVSVFLGLKGASKKSSLNLISKSQKIKDNPQTLGIDSDEDAANYCNNLVDGCELINVDIDEGEFFIFDGLTWHSSDNKTGTDRFALIIQYTTPDHKIKIPCNWNEPINWHESIPSCLLVKGEDHFQNNPHVNLAFEQNEK